MQVHLGILLSVIYLRHYASADASDNSLVASPPPINCVCPFIYQPVCGTDGDTYSNKCVLECVSADNVQNGRPPIYVQQNGPCPSANCLCPANIQPVCGSDGRTYSNECTLICESNRRVKLGLSPIYLVSRTACSQIRCYCSSVVIPVCGTDGVTYRNICYLQCASRRNQAQGLPPIYYKSTGACPIEACGCPPDPKPVCASDGKTYPNRCSLDCENRRRNALGLRPLWILNDGPCFSCNCPKIEDPVCASDGKTYHNPCLLNCENEVRKKLGLPPLTIVNKGMCACNCPQYVDPVCGSDGVTYNNVCELRCENIKREYQGLPPINLAYRGRCVCNCSQCSLRFDPQCGSDNKTYWNICWLECHSKCNVLNGLPKITVKWSGYC